MTKKSRDDLLSFLKAVGKNYESRNFLEKDNEFSSVVSDLVFELGKSHDVSSNVYPLTDEYEYANFASGLEKFLISYGCPYSALTEGPICDRFSSVKNRSLLLQYLCSEIMATRQLSTLKSVGKQSNEHHLMDVDSSEDNVEILSCLQKAFKALGLKMPPDDSASTVIYSCLQKGISDSLSRCPPNHMGKSIIPLTGISDRQWSQIIRIAALLQQQYSSRQATLLKRLDVTVQSFKWSDKAKSSLDKITTVYNQIRERMGLIPYPGIPNVLAVRDNMILQIEKTSGTNARRYTSCELNKILIGKVVEHGNWSLLHLKCLLLNNVNQIGVVVHREVVAVVVATVIMAVVGVFRVVIVVIVVMDLGMVEDVLLAAISVAEELVVVMLKCMVRRRHT
ncbi:unnamed protein product [Schistosoma rodhaini]|nr:unnamed protein product [Schistosoma rodhaini]